MPFIHRLRSPRRRRAKAGARSGWRSAGTRSRESSPRCSSCGSWGRRASTWPSRGRAARGPSIPGPSRSGTSGSCCSRAGRAAEDGDRAADLDGPAGTRRRPGRAVHRLGGLDPGRPAICGGATWRTSRWRTTWSSATGAPRGLAWIREVHSKIIQDKRPVVIIHDNPEAIDLPDKQDDAGVQRRLHRQGRPDQRGHPPPRPGAPGPTRSWSSPTTARGNMPTARPS